MTRKTRSIAPLLALSAAFAIALAGGGCTKITPPEYNDPLLPQTSEKNVLNNLQVAWRMKRIDVYCALLADDYQFYFDEDTRTRQGLPVFWTRLDDSTGTGGLFASVYTRGITITLTGITDPPVHVDQIGRETWTKVDVLHTNLEVEIDPNPKNAEGVTYRVTNSLQKFFFRKGRNAADTDTLTSATAKLYYIVEWDDMGLSGS